MTDDPFPRARFAATIHRLPAYLRLAFGVAKDPALAKIRRVALVAAAGYLISPLDIVPDAIPVVGQLDDLAVALAALRFALAGLDPQRRRRHLAVAGLTDADLAEDLAMLRAVMAWTLRAGARTTMRTARRGGRVATTGAGVAGMATTGALRISPARVRGAAAPIGRFARAARARVRR